MIKSIQAGSSIAVQAIKMTKTPQKSPLKTSLIVAITSLCLWLVLAISLIIMLNGEGGIDGIILHKPMLFFGLLAASVFFLATGLNNIISYFKANRN